MICIRWYCCKRLIVAGIGPRTLIGRLFVAITASSRCLYASHAIDSLSNFGSRKPTNAIFHTGGRLHFLRCPISSVTKPLKSYFNAYFIAGLSANIVCTITLPCFSLRPARPATWERSWNVRSFARKSGSVSEVSALMIPTRVTFGKCNPFASICVPANISVLPAPKSLRTL